MSNRNRLIEKTTDSWIGYLLSSYEQCSEQTKLGYLINAATYKIRQ